MNPSNPILHRSFRYVSSTSTSVADTWRRFGWRPTTDEERNARQWRSAGVAGELAPGIVPVASDCRFGTA